MFELELERGLFRLTLKTPALAPLFHLPPHNGKRSILFPKLATTTSSGGLFLPLLRGIVTARPEGRYRKHFYWYAIKRYFLNLLFEILLLALLYTFELLHLLYYLLFRRNILLPKRLYPIYSAALDVYHKP